MYRYVVSFGVKKNRSSASFVKYAYAEKFFHECVAAGLLNVQLNTIETDEEGDYIDRS